MNGIYFQAFTFFCVVWTGTQPFQWTDDLDDNDVKYVCAGDDLQLLWNFTLSPGEDVLALEWFYEGRSEELIGMVVHDGFVALPAFGQRVQFVPGAGIVLRRAVSADRGNYSLEVSVDTGASSFITERRNVTVEIAESPAANSGHLVIRQDKMAVYDNDTDQWSIQLSCGHFTNLGQPPVHVVWQTPFGSRQSASFKDGNFYFRIPNPVQGGNYSCSIPPQSPATSCLFNSSRLLQMVHVSLDGHAARLTVIEAHEKDLQTKYDELEHRNQELEEKEDNMTHYINQLQEVIRANQIQNQNDILKLIADPVCGGGNYTMLDDYTRDINHGHGFFCDNYLAPGWYRFFINGTDAVIPTAHPSSNHCGTAVPLCLDLQGGSLPDVGQDARVLVYGLNHRTSTQDHVTVRNCGAFYVYRMQRAKYCNSRYCVTVKTF